MAYFTRVTNTETTRALTEAEEEQKNSYISAQVAAGTTDGNLYSWNGTPLSASFRIWTSQAAATGFQSLWQGFSPPIAMSVY